MIFIAGGALAFFFEFLLLSKREKTLSDKILAVWMFMIGLQLLMYYFWDSGLAREYPVLMGISAPFPFLHGPMLFLYTSSLTRRIRRWEPQMFLHFTPLLFFYVYNFRFYFQPREEQREFVESVMHHEGPLFFRLAAVLILLSAATYHVLTLTLFRRHKRNIKEQFSYTDEKINLNWLRNLIIGMSVIWVVVIANSLQLSLMEDDDMIYVTVVLFVFFIGFFGVRQGNIFVTPLQQTDEPGEGRASAQEKRYAKSGLKEETANEMENRLKELMERQKLFLDDTLTLGKVAKMVDISPTYLSQVINERFRKNFYDFVNSYRIEEFKNQLKDPVKKNYTILSLAYEVGFNSKSSFNKYFKQSTGKTPSEFLKSA